MKHIDFYFDFISPYAYLAFEQLPKALAGHSVSVSYPPILFASLLAHHGQLGPAEIPAKRLWTYRQVEWLARQLEVPFQMPVAHPFSPLPWLRLALATVAQGDPNRHTVETLFRQIWNTGADAADPAHWQAAAQHLSLLRAVDAASVKDQLRSNSEQALARQLFGVPSMVVDDQVFWGLDSLPMLTAYLAGDVWFSGPQWRDAGDRPVGVSRSQKAG